MNITARWRRDSPDPKPASAGRRKPWRVRKSVGPQGLCRFDSGRPHQFLFQYCRSSQRDATGAESKDGTLRGVSVSFACSLSICCQSMFAIIAISLLFSPQRAYLKIMPERVELLFVFRSLSTQSLRFAFMDFGFKLSIMYQLGFQMHLYLLK